MPRVLIVLYALAAMAGHASAQIVRVSVSTTGVQANGASGAPSISADGRYVVFESLATNLVAGDTNGYPDIFLRDRDTDADGVFDEPGAVATIRVNVGLQGQQMGSGSYNAVISANGRFVFFGSFDPSLAPFPAVGFSIFRVDLTDGTMLRVGSDLAFETTPAVSADGDVLVYQHSGIGLMIRQTSTGATIPVPTPYTPVPGPGQTEALLFHASPTISADGRRIAYVTAVGRGSGPPFEPTEYRAWEFDRVSGVTTLLATDDPRAVSITASGESAVLRLAEGITRRVTASGARTPVLAAPSQTPHRVRPIVSPTGRFALTEGAILHDFDTGLSTSLGFALRTSLACPQTGCMSWGAFGGDDRMLALVSPSPLVAGDTNGNDVFVIDLRDQLDADDDTMDDRLETLFGVTDPAADPDGDGQTNAQELAAGTHPNGQVQRFLAEGATGAFFHTTIALANPSPTLPASAVLTFDRGDGTRIRRAVGVPAGRSAVVDVGAVAGAESADVSTTVESDRLLGVQRSMTWGIPTGTVYGSHAETATAAPSPTWFLAEGSTVLGFDLFYLLQNPQTIATTATVRFLLPSGTVISRTYNLAAGSRTTIYVNQVEGLDETDVSGDISAGAPIVVERAMYRGSPSQPFALGHDSIGVPAAATSWFLAEGATGSFFDLYVLIANPGNTDAIVRADYARPDGSVVTQNYTVRAHSRHSVYVDSIAGLTATSVATTLTSTNGVPIVAERAMYWPGGFFEYYEGHSSAGSTSTALDWVVAEGASGGVTQAQTFVLIANTENRTGEATLTILPEGSNPAVPPIVTSLPPNSRTTIPLPLSIPVFGVRVQSTGASPVQLVVESAVYRSPDGTGAGPIWSAGSNALATPVP